MRVQDGSSHRRVHVGVPREWCRHEGGSGALPPCSCPALFLPGLLTVVPPWGCRWAPAPQPVSAALRPGSCLALSLGLPSVGPALRHPGWQACGGAEWHCLRRRGFGWLCLCRPPSGLSLSTIPWPDFGRQSFCVFSGSDPRLLLSERPSLRALQRSVRPLGPRAKRCKGVT